MQKKNLRFLLTLLAAVASLAAFSVACGDLEESCDDTDPESEADNCVCDDPEDEASCHTVNNENNSTANNSNNANNTVNNTVNNNPNNSANNGGTAFRFVLVEDLSADNANGATPGADVDAIGLELSDGTQVWADSVEDFEIGGANNEYVDTTELLGAPDAVACETSGAALGGFTSLGGVGDNSYVIVGFAGTTFGSGDAVIVWELGPTNCGDAQPGWLDDETAISISASTDAASFERIGSVGTGSNAIVIP